MKHLRLVAFVFFLQTIVCCNTFAQTFTTLNKGGSSRKDYYSVIPYEEFDNLMIIKVMINGKEYRFLFDTGAMVCISDSLMKELQLPEIKRLEISDSSDKKDSLSVVMLKEIQLDSLFFRDIPAMVFKENEQFTCLGIDGIIGSNLLRNSIVRFSKLERNIVITDNPKRLNLKSKKKLSQKLFLTHGQSSPYFRLEIKNKKTARVQLLFDSGSNGFFDLSLRHFNHFEKYRGSKFYDILSKTEGGSSLGVHGKENDTVQYALHTQNMKINRAVFKEVNFYSTADDNSRVGAALLKHGVVTIDYINKRFYFEPYFEKEKELAEKIQPLRLTWDKGRPVVGIVWDETLRKTISPGDIVLFINDENMENLFHCDFMKNRWNYFQGDKVTLTVRKAEGIVRTVSVMDFIMQQNNLR
ncbi:MAG: aspartyl protease family protein [Dysgonamonadaceae bacterium]|jgi:hypothetical protein|nr:aspartyl protease family protein [Dysgonamonadaceae bacterium]